MSKKVKLVSLVLCLLLFVQFGSFNLIPFMESDAFAATTMQNIAWGKAAFTDSQSPYYRANYGNDGSNFTRWCASDGNGGHWWKVDLGGFYNLTGTDVYWYKPVGAINKYKIEVSSNNKDWTLKVNRTNNIETGNTQTDAFFANNVRYVRITVTGLNLYVWASFSEFCVYGSKVDFWNPWIAPPINPGNTPTGTTSIITPTITPTASPTVTPTITPTVSSTITPTITPTVTNSPTPTPSNTPTGNNVVPGKIEAENYNSMSGIQTETCSQGTLNISYVDAGDWLDYIVNVQNAGSYQVKFNIASKIGSSSAIQLKSGGNVLCTVNVPNTGGWQSWTSVSSGNITLNAGQQTLRIYANASGWNMNWFQFVSAQASTSTPVSTPTTTPTATPMATPTITPTSTPSVTPSSIGGYAPVIATDENVIGVIRVTPSTTANPLPQLYQKQDLTYSLTGSAFLQGPRKKKEIILALDTSASMGTTSDSTVLNDKIFDYTLFSGLADPGTDSISFSSTKFTVTGNVHSNSKIGIFTSDKGTIIDGNIEAVNSIHAYNQTFQNGSISAATLDLGACTYINAVEKPASNIPVVTGMIPLSLDLLKEKALNSGKFYPASTDPSKPVIIFGETLNSSCPVYVEDNLEIQTGTYNGSGLISASGDVTLNATSITQNMGGALCIYSNKDISINCASGAFYGMIYAPNGTVKLSGTNFTIHGRVIAKSIQSASGDIKIVDQGYPTLVNEIKNFLDTRIKFEKKAAKNFIDKFAGTDTKIGVVLYGKTASLVRDSSNNILFSMANPADVTFIKAYIDNVQYNSDMFAGTNEAMRNTGDGMRRAYYVLNNSPDINASKFVVVFSDGDANVWTMESAGGGSSLKTDGDALYVSDKDVVYAKTYAAQDIGGLIQDNGYTSYFLAITGANAQLNSIASAAGAAVVSGAYRYYIPTSSDNISSNTIKVATIIYNDIRFIEYADDLQFSSATFNEIFPAGVAAVAVAPPYNDSFTISKITSGTYAGRYLVSGNIDGLTLSKDPTDGIYKLMPVPNIVITVRYTSLTGPRTKISTGVYSSNVLYANNAIEYIDYFGLSGNVKAQDHNQAVIFKIDSH